MAQPLTFQIYTTGPGLGKETQVLQSSEAYMSAMLAEGGVPPLFQQETP